MTDTIITSEDGAEIVLKPTASIPGEIVAASRLLMREGLWLRTDDLMSWLEDRARSLVPSGARRGHADAIGFHGDSIIIRFPAIGGGAGACRVAATPMRTDAGFAYGMSMRAEGGDGPTESVMPQDIIDSMPYDDGPDGRYLLDVPSFSRRLATARNLEWLGDVGVMN